MNGQLRCYYVGGCMDGFSRIEPSTISERAFLVPLSGAPHAMVAQEGPAYQPKRHVYRRAAVLRLGSGERAAIMAFEVEE